VPADLILTRTNASLLIDALVHFSNSVLQFSARAAAITGSPGLRFCAWLQLQARQPQSAIHWGSAGVEASFATGPPNVVFARLPPRSGKSCSTKDPSSRPCKSASTRIGNDEGTVLWVGGSTEGIRRPFYVALRRGSPAHRKPALLSVWPEAVWRALVNTISPLWTSLPGKKEFAEFFREALEAYVGPVQLVYARHSRGQSGVASSTRAFTRWARSKNVANVEAVGVTQLQICCVASVPAKRPGKPSSPATSSIRSAASFNEERDNHRTEPRFCHLERVVEEPRPWP